ncbi:hypothetical protein KST_03925 [Mycobacterium marinum]|nr:hypothetical protein KST_03925 [Mycobacterium marinum]
MYFKSGLHPDDVDHSENLETWRGNIWVDWPIARAPVADNCDPLSLSALSRSVLGWDLDERAVPSHALSGCDS